MTELSPFTNHGGALTAQHQQSPIATTDTTMSILEWAQELDAAGRIANVLCNTEFVPKGLRGSVEATAAAILTGREIGLSPMNALANIFVVQGKPAMYARAMVALVLSHGHELERTAATERAVTVRARRKGSQQWQEFTWTIERAQKAGYTSNALYAKDPQAMLTAKCQTEACRTMFPDVLSGMASTSVEELNLDGVIEVTEEPPAKAVEAPKRTARRKAAPTPAPEPEAPAAADTPPEEPEHAGDTNPDEDPQPEQDAPSTRSQWIRLSNALETIGVTEKTAKADEMRDWAQGQGLDRDINSAADLTSNETEAFIRELTEIAAAAQQTETGEQS